MDLLPQAGLPDPVLRKTGLKKWGHTQKNTQMKEKKESVEKTLNEKEASSLSEFKVTVIKMFKQLSETYKQLNYNYKKLKGNYLSKNKDVEIKHKNPQKMKTDTGEIKNTLEGNNSRLEAEEQISKLEYKVGKNRQIRAAIRKKKS